LLKEYEKRTTLANAEVELQQQDEQLEREREEHQAELQREQEDCQQEREAFQRQVCDLFIFNGTYMPMIHVDCITFEGHGDEVVGRRGG
jgi:hypothetical protein